MGIDTRYQVRHLIEGIKITELDTFKAQIMATASLRTDYDVCVSLYMTCIYQSEKSSPPELNISGVESSKHKGVHKKLKGGSGGAVEYVYYSKEEYKALSSNHRESHYKKRQARKHIPTEKKVRFKGGGAKIKLVKQVSTLVYVMK